MLREQPRRGVTRCPTRHTSLAMAAAARGGTMIDAPVQGMPYIAFIPREETEFHTSSQNQTMLSRCSDERDLNAITTAIHRDSLNACPAWTRHNYRVSTDRAHLAGTLRGVHIQSLGQRDLSFFENRSFCCRLTQKSVWSRTQHHAHVYLVCWYGTTLSKTNDNLHNLICTNN